MYALPKLQVFLLFDLLGRSDDFSPAYEIGIL